MRAGKPWRSRKAEEATLAGLTIADMFRQRFGLPVMHQSPTHTTERQL